MAKSKYEYVKGFEQDNRCLSNTWIVVRLDGRAFHRFSEQHGFLKPNDVSALNLMNRCATRVIEEFQDILVAYGQSDEYSFIFKRNTTLFSRRLSKIISTLVSFFSSCYVYHWSEFMRSPLMYPPSFDGRISLFPSEENVQDYLKWRQSDCHINNLYNTCYWALLHSGLKPEEAEKTIRAKANFSADKHELLFQQFGINYNNEAEQFKKGTLLFKEFVERHEFDSGDSCENQTEKCLHKQQQLTKPDENRKRKKVLCLHIDIIGDKFWEEHCNLLV